MLAILRLGCVRSALVIMMMILSALVAVERAQSVINSVQHALAIEHTAPLAQASADHADHHDDDHDHDRAAQAEALAGDEPDHAPGPHHHHSDAPQIAALTSPMTLEAVTSRAEAGFRLSDTGAPMSRIFGLDRPPKAHVSQA